MKILLVSGSAPPMACGVGDYTYKLAQELAKNHDVKILTSKGAHDLRMPNLEVLPLIDTWRLRKLPIFKKILAEFKPDVVHIQYPCQGYSGGLLHFLIPLVSFALGYKVIQTWHEFLHPINIKFFPIYGWVPGGLVTVRPNYIKASPLIVKLLSLTKRHVTIPNTSLIPSSKLSHGEANALRDTLIKGQKRLIICFGFITPAKGTHRAFELADPIRDHLLIVGQFGPDEEYNSLVRKLAMQSNWSNQVTFTGYCTVDEAANYFKVSDAAIYPIESGAGSWNTSLHAAIVNGCPFVATATSSLEKSEHGTYVKNNEWSEFKKELEFILSHSPYDTRAFNNQQNDEWERIKMQHEKLYKNLTSAE
jgi:glycosyltransferase involved in cell wall biosynthesis